jgi:hypothetical protein
MIDDLIRDPRQADIDEAQRLLSTADRTGLAPLPSLFAVDLCVLGAHRQAMFDKSVVQAWAALTGSTREQFGGEALDGLTQRGLLSREPSRGHDPELTTHYRVHPALALLLAARARPVWLAVCSVTSSACAGPRMYGLGSAAEPLRGAVVESLRNPASGPPADAFDVSGLHRTVSPAELGKVYDYVLASTTRAADLLAGWSMLPMPRSGAVGRSLTRTVDVYHHQKGHGLSRLRVSVEGDEKQARVSVGERGAAQILGDYDQSALAEHLQKVIRRLS